MNPILNPLVSVCVTTYNRKNLLKFTIESILNQTYENFEILIVDDASSDGTEEFIKNEIIQMDKRIRYFRHTKNKGLAEGRNTAIYNAKGKFFTFCDDDDIWHNLFLAEFINISYEFTQEWSFCCGQINKKSCDIIPNFEFSFKDALLNGYTPPVASQFYLTKNLIEINGYNTKIKSGVDHDLWIRFACNKKEYKIKGLSKALVIRQKIHNYEKITTNENKRISRIKTSLNIWEEDISKYFSKEFFNFFTRNYLYYENKKFFFINLKNKEFKKVRNNLNNMEIVFMLKDFMLTKHIINSLIRKIFFKIGFKQSKLNNIFFKFNKKL